MTPKQFKALTALAGLRSPKTTQALRLILLSGHSVTDAARMVGVSPSSASHALARARKTIALAGGIAPGDRTAPDDLPTDELMKLVDASTKSSEEYLAAIKRTREDNERDAERYRFIRDEAQWIKGAPQAIAWEPGQDAQEILSEDELDEAVDKAMAASAKTGCPQGCKTECLAKVHGCASECPALPWQPTSAQGEKP